MFVRSTVRAFREYLSIFVCLSFPFGFVSRMWDVIVLIPDFVPSPEYIELFSCSIQLSMKF